MLHGSAWARARMVRASASQECRTNAPPVASNEHHCHRRGGPTADAPRGNTCRNTPPLLESRGKDARCKDRNARLPANKKTASPSTSRNSMTRATVRRTEHKLRRRPTLQMLRRGTRMPAAAHTMRPIADDAMLQVVGCGGSDRLPPRSPLERGALANLGVARDMPIRTYALVHNKSLLNATDAHPRHIARCPRWHFDTPRPPEAPRTTSGIDQVPRGSPDGRPKDSGKLRPKARRRVARRSQYHRHRLMPWGRSFRSRATDLLFVAKRLRLLSARCARNKVLLPAKPAHATRGTGASALGHVPMQQGWRMMLRWTLG